MASRVPVRTRMVRARTVRVRVVTLALLALGVVAELGLGVGFPGRALGFPASAAAAPSANWTTYHHDNQRGGYDASQPAFGSNIVAGWAAPTAVDGAVYAEPLVTGNTVVVATENNSVYALNAATGAVLWHDNLGPPVSNSSLPCGNVNPVGITSTPVIDASAGIVYVMGLVQPAGQAMNYQVAAINLASGAINYQHIVSISGLDPQHHNQRGALTLLNGTLYIPFGGRYGDCGPYEGWLVGLPASGSGNPITFRSNTDGNAAGFWQPAGATVDSSGNLYATSGNTINCGSPSRCTYDGGETIYKLSPALSTLSTFYPSNWATLDVNDTDIGSTDPLPVNGSLIFQVGKSGDGYLVRQSNLGGQGGQAFTAHVCPGLTSDAAFGGAAYVDPYIYVPCSDGVVALTLNSAAPSFAFAWHGPSESYASPPIVAGGLVWTVDTAGTLFALNPTTGATVFSASVGAAAAFATPAAGNGAVYVAAAKKVYAFVSGSAPTPTATATSTATATATGTATATATATPAITPTPGAPLFSDTFEQDAIGSIPAGWSVSAQTPSGVTFKVIQDGSHVVQHTNWGGKLVINQSVGWTDVSVSMQVKTSGWGNSAKEGIAVRLRDYAHYLRLVLIGTTTLEIDAVDSGTATKLASVPFASSGGVWYTLRLDVIGSTLTGYVNGQQRITATAPSGYASGQVGIDSSTPAAYDNVSVTSPGSGGTPTPTPTMTATATATVTATATATSTVTASPTATATPSATPTATATSTPSATPTATRTATPITTATATTTPTATPTITPTPGSTLFTDTFEQDTLGATPAGWTISAQTPSGVMFNVIQDGSHVVQHTNWGGKLIITNSATWANVSVTVQVNTSGWGNSAKEGIAVRQSDYQHYLRLVLIGTTTLELDAVDNGTATPLASVPFVSSGGVWYTLRLDIIGSTLTGYVNGQEEITATAPSGYTSGGIGIDSSTPAEYDNVVVTSL